MLPETSMVPTNSYLAFMSAPKHRRDELHIAAPRTLRNRLRNPARPNNVAPMSNTALRTIRLRCAGDPLGVQIPVTNYAA